MIENSKGPVTLQYEAMCEEKYSKTKPLNAQIQEYYNKIRDLQNEVKEIEESYKAQDEALRKQAVVSGENAPFLSHHDKMRFNPAIVNYSKEKVALLKNEIMKGRKQYDETDLYEKVKSLCASMKIDYNKIMHEDLHTIDQALIEANRYIFGM